MLQLKQLRDQAQVLQHDVQTAQRNYDSITARVGQADLESRSSLSNIAVLKTATAPAQASSPRLGLNLTLALVLGSALAVAWILLRELRDRRLRSADDVSASLGLPLLIELPGNHRHARNSPWRPWLQRDADGTAGPAR